MSKQQKVKVIAFVESLSRRKSTILLVDDQPKNLKLLSDVLEEQGLSEWDPEAPLAVHAEVDEEVPSTPSTAE